jgi:hypothetical protein
VIPEDGANTPVLRPIVAACSEQWEDLSNTRRGETSHHVPMTWPDRANLVIKGVRVDRGPQTAVAG